MTPDQFTLKEQMLDVGDSHQLYVQLWGNKNAKEAIIYLHGGPGSGCSDSAKTFFDPKRHKVVFFDQRGCGKSTPYGLLKNNDTDHSVKDINLIAKNFGIDKFVLTGGSWGSCLALVYAIRNPARVSRMVLRGIFTGRKSEIDFLDKGGFRDFFPDAWEEFVASAPAKYHDEPMEYHLPRILGGNGKEAKESAFAYSNLAGAVSRLDDRLSTEKFEDFDPVPAVIECYFLAQNCFLTDDYIIKNASKLKMLVDLVQGRYDAMCPPITAFELSKKLPNGNLIWTLAGHGGHDRPNWQAVKALLLR